MSIVYLSVLVAQTHLVAPSLKLHAVISQQRKYSKVKLKNLLLHLASLEFLGFTLKNQINWAKQ